MKYFLPLLLLISFEAWAAAERPADWVSHLVNPVEIIELPYHEPSPEVASILMVPALFQNAALFDLDPDHQISVARYLMREFHLHVYLLNTRNLGLASRERHLNLDQLAKTDLPIAIQWVSKRANAPIYVFGHSQGSIVLQASMGGLTDLNDAHGSHFDRDIAEARQSKVRGLILSSGSLTFRTEKKWTSLNNLDLFSRLIIPPLRNLIGRVDLSWLTRSVLFAPLTHAWFWKDLYNKHNVSRESERLLFERTVESSSMGILRQLDLGIRHHGITTVDIDDEGEAYLHALPLIQVPTIQVVYGDCFADPIPTYEDDFVKIGSKAKAYFPFAALSHEDVFMNEDLHSILKEPLTRLFEMTAQH